jgi:hypothetical protein
MVERGGRRVSIRVKPPGAVLKYISPAIFAGAEIF